MKDNKVISLGISLGSIISLFLVWFIYFKTEVTVRPDWLTHIPLANAVCNALSAFNLVYAVMAIKKGMKTVHIRHIAIAMFFSAVFLVGYLVFHHYIGDTKFTGTGAIRPIYFFILITHIILSIVVVPLIIITVTFALTQAHDKHKKFAKWTFPIWLYVSVTGVLIFILLKAFNHA